ncbi:MAG: macro domain-containing protein [Puniceicoccales bacterium]|jgi:O-acetyl-ADP-ribose deacetylase (regulator of RNase III)|nr:macro domain-containing protein [Puniceicoccales bacterium]
MSLTLGIQNVVRNADFFKSSPYNADDRKIDVTPTLLARIGYGIGIVLGSLIWPFAFIIYAIIALFRSTASKQKSPSVTVYGKKQQQTIPLACGKCCVVLTTADSCFLDTNAMMNAASQSMRPGGGIDGAVEQYGGKKLAEERKQYYDRLEVGGAVMTSSGDGQIRSKYIIHVCGPIVRGRPSTADRKNLTNCYISAFELCDKNNIQDFAICMVSAGIYGYPKEEAVQVAFETTTTWLENHPQSSLKVLYFNVFDEACLGKAVSLFKAYESGGHGMAFGDYLDILKELHSESYSS